MAAADHTLDPRLLARLLLVGEQRERRAREAVTACIAAERAAAAATRLASEAALEAREALVTTEQDGLDTLHATGPAPPHRVSALRRHLDALAGQSALRDVALEAAAAKEHAARATLSEARLVLDQAERGRRKREDLLTRARRAQAHRAAVREELRLEDEVGIRPPRRKSRA